MEDWCGLFPEARDAGLARQAPSLSRRGSGLLNRAKMRPCRVGSLPHAPSRAWSRTRRGTRPRTRVPSLAEISRTKGNVNYLSLRTFVKPFALGDTKVMGAPAGPVSQLGGSSLTEESLPAAEP